MCNVCKEVYLGFTSEKVPMGTHMCLIYTTEEERKTALNDFLLSGLQGKERMACFSNKVTEEELKTYFESHSVPYDKKVQNAMSLSGTNDIYFENGIFDPDRMLNTLKAFYEESIAMGFPASRVIGEMVPEVENVPGGDRLLEYESRVTMLLRNHPVTTVCQYDANAFDGATILEIFKVHPTMIVNGAVVKNPFFIEPEIYLAK